MRIKKTQLVWHKKDPFSLRLKGRKPKFYLQMGGKVVRNLNLIAIYMYIQLTSVRYACHFIYTTTQLAIALQCSLITVLFT
jgi:hypothetical protein